MTTGYKFISTYFGNKIKEIIAESEISKYIKENQIKNVYIGLKKIENFEFKLDDNRFICLHAFKKGAKRKYYVSLLNHSIAIKNETIIFASDINFDNYEDYKKGKLNEKSLNILSQN